LPFFETPLDVFPMNAGIRLSIGSVSAGIISKLLFCTLLFVGRAAGQADQEPRKLGAPDPQPSTSLVLAPPANVYVSVREPNGLPVTENATVKLLCPLAGINMTGATNDTALAQFPNIPAGECTVEVGAPGYKPTHERTLVADSLKPDDQYVYVYLHPSSEGATTWAHTQVSLNVLKEMDKGTQAMRKNHADEARKHFLKAEETAPQNPDVQYLLGLLESSLKDQDAASARYERAVSLYPTYEHALVALGEIQLRNKNAREAAATLEKAVRANTMSYRAQLYLAAALMQQGDYTRAKPHAQKAVELAGGDKVAMARALLGEILIAEGQRDAARHEFDLVVRDYPKDPVATIAKSDLEDVDKAINVAISRASAALSSTGNEGSTDAELGTGPIRPWGPSDVDTIKPGVAGDVTCSTADVVTRAGKASTEQLGNFDKFMASEHIEHEEIDRDGKPGAVRAHDFSYLAFSYQAKDGQTYLDESRDGGTGIESFPTSIATVGLAGLGAYIFRPGFADALDFTCEGLGQWRGKAAWLMYFRQKPNQRSNLRRWRTKKITVEIPLKGRVWLAATTYQVLHLETDLREPVTELELTREHLAIDYGPVVFRNGQTELWVPWYADMFLELHHRRYHHRHTLSNYTFFAVDTKDTIGKPKEVQRTEELPQAP
jgi:tetratricopeptide (TPR) repeat protein